jgi:hypothetical protein
MRIILAFMLFVSLVQAEGIFTNEFLGQSVGFNSQINTDADGMLDPQQNEILLTTKVNL